MGTIVNMNGNALADLQSQRFQAMYSAQIRGVSKAVYTSRDLCSLIQMGNLTFHAMVMRVPLRDGVKVILATTALKSS